MDFATILSSEIKKRKFSAPATSSTDHNSNASDTSDPSRKYLKRAEVEFARQAEYLASQARLEAERVGKAAKRRDLELLAEARYEALREKKRRLAEESRGRREDAEARLRWAKKDENDDGDDGDGDDDKKDSSTADAPEAEAQPELPDEEVFARLQRLQQPIKLFGETPGQRISRLLKLECDREAGGAVKTENPPTPRSTTLKSLPLQPRLSEANMQINLSEVTDNPSKVYNQLLSWFRQVLLEWDLTLSSRPLAVRQTYSGKAATNAYVQAKEYMTPLFKHLEKQDLHPDIFSRVCEIVYFAQQRKYVTANDVYLKLSIGNAAWPIGVTMVGIHERSAREKLHEKGMAAHIMSDEVTRKYLQSIKRCLKFCQMRWPPEDQLQLMG